MTSFPRQRVREAGGEGGGQKSNVSLHNIVPIHGSSPTSKNCPFTPIFSRIKKVGRTGSVARTEFIKLPVHTPRSMFKLLPVNVIPTFPNAQRRQQFTETHRTPLIISSDTGVTTCIGDKIIDKIYLTLHRACTTCNFYMGLSGCFGKII